MSARAASLSPRAAAPRRDLRVVKRRSRKLVKPTSKRLSAAIAMAIVAGAIVFGILLEQVMLAQSAFKLTRLRKQVAEAQVLHEELLLVAAQLDNDARIERFAREELGMIDAEPTTVRYIVADVGRGARNGSGARLALPDGSDTGPGVAAAIEGAAP